MTLSITLKGFLEQVRHHLGFKVFGKCKRYQQIIEELESQKGTMDLKIPTAFFLPSPSTFLIFMGTGKGTTRRKVQILIHRRGMPKGVTKIEQWGVHSFPGESGCLCPRGQQMEFCWRGSRTYNFLSLFRKILNNTPMSPYERSEPIMKATN